MKLFQVQEKPVPYMAVDVLYMGIAKEFPIPTTGPTEALYLLVFDSQPEDGKVLKILSVYGHQDNPKSRLIWMALERKFFPFAFVEVPRFITSIRNAMITHIEISY